MTTEPVYSGVSSSPYQLEMLRLPGKKEDGSQSWQVIVSDGRWRLQAFAVVNGQSQGERAGFRCLWDPDSNPSIALSWRVTSAGFSPWDCGLLVCKTKADVLS